MAEYGAVQCRIRRSLVLSGGSPLSPDESRPGSLVPPHRKTSWPATPGAASIFGGRTGPWHNARTDGADPSWSASDAVALLLQNRGSEPIMLRCSKNLFATRGAGEHLTRRQSASACCLLGRFLPKLGGAAMRRHLFRLPARAYRCTNRYAATFCHFACCRIGRTQSSFGLHGQAENAPFLCLVTCFTRCDVPLSAIPLSRRRRGLHGTVARRRAVKTAGPQSCRRRIAAP